jgi:dGTPase
MKQEEGDQLIYKRHPLVYLVEAADDICYNIIDLEDAHRLRILSYKEVEELLLAVCNEPGLERRLDEIDDKEAKIGLLRAKSISKLIAECSEVFFREQAAILSGDFNEALIDRVEGSCFLALKKIKEISVQQIYNHPTVVQIEVAGYKVIGGLLEEFVPAYLEDEKTAYQKKLVELIPRQFYTTEKDAYSRIMSVLDFVSGMTDLYAVELYRRIKGMSFPALA